MSWYAAWAYCRWLSSQVPSAAGARLPSEAEWEYACRGGTQTRYWQGDAESDLGEVGWYGANSAYRTHRVGQKPANPWGLYDVHGNVWEWTSSEWSMDYAGREDGIEIDPSAEGRHADAESRHVRAELSGGSRVYRGGSFWGDAWNARSAYRNSSSPQHWYRDHGFRVLRPAARASRS